MNSIEKAFARLTETPETPDTSLQQRTAIFPTLAVQEKETEQRFVSKMQKLWKLDFEALAQDGYLTPNSMHNTLAEDYRFLKLSVLQMANGIEINQLECENLVAITSSLRGEGKTFTSFNLAMSIALERDTTVLLIDGDLIGRSLTELLGLHNAIGLTDFLLDPHIDLRDIILHTNVPKLRLIPAGRTYRDATELMSSKKMQNLALDLSARYGDRIVLFDTPPLLATSLAVVLTSLVRQILVVVEEGRTPQNRITKAISLLDDSKAVSMVLNKCPRWSKGDYYKNLFE